MRVRTRPDVEMVATKPGRGDLLAWVFIGAAGVMALAMAGLRPTDEVVYNGTPSMPVGFYVRTDAPLERGAIVTVRAADVARVYARLRGFAGAHDRFIKRVVGVSGDRVCAHTTEVDLNGVVIAQRQSKDPVGRALPSWSGCETLHNDQIFLLGESEDSFDGRYFGPVERAKIEGVWRPLFVHQHREH